MKKSAVLLAAGMLGLLVSGCGSIVDMGGGSRTIDPRRMFVNDPALNALLPSSIVDQGVFFVLQPGKPYTLHVRNGSAGVLDFWEQTGNNSFGRLEVLTGTTQGGDRNFALQAPESRDSAAFYVAFFRATSGAQLPAPESVRLFPADTSLQSDTLSVRLLMVRQLTGYADSAAKAAYAQLFHAKLKSVYAAYGITVDTSTLVVEPNSAPLTVSFDTVLPALPGARLAGAINLYLVDNIQSDRTGAGSTVLGFAPREALDLSTNRESRVLLNVRGGDPVDMAVTAAHEIGHFLGLRHTTATQVDRDADGDESNRNDGFASTPFCPALEKRPPAEIILPGNGGRPYCLRVAGTSITCGCDDRNNLMYPYQCQVTQETLGSDQQVFLRRNLRLYQ